MTPGRSPAEDRPARMSLSRAGVAQSAERLLPKSAGLRAVPPCVGRHDFDPSYPLSQQRLPDAESDGCGAQTPSRPKAWVVALRPDDACRSVSRRGTPTSVSRARRPDEAHLVIAAEQGQYPVQLRSGRELLECDTVELSRCTPAGRTGLGRAQRIALKTLGARSHSTVFAVGIGPLTVEGPA